MRTNSKFIFVTGGVLSGLGKGITAASIGNILKARGISVFMQKFDQYLNVDAGTLNPAEHGEVFVTEDGAETDLDLGHYERFIDVNLTQASSVMSGNIYESILSKERQGKFLGKTVQVIPHVTNEVKDRIYKTANESKAQVLICEIGGTVGDYEGMHFLEAIRQIKYELNPKDTLFVHVGFLPYLGATEELKSKPLQNSIRDLQGIGIRPDIIIARSDRNVPDNIIDKLALYSGLDKKAVIPLVTAKYVYEVPLTLEHFDLDSLIIKNLNLTSNDKKNLAWKKMVNKIKKEKNTKINIALVGKYMGMKDTYLSVTEAIKAGGWNNDTEVQIHWIDSENLEKPNTNILKKMDGLLVPGGFGTRGVEGKIMASKFARENKIPYLGLCLGMQIAIIEFARNVLGLKKANSTEFSSKTPDPVIHIMPEQQKLIEGSSYGHTMRLGSYPCILDKKSKVASLYKQTKIYERHRHRYELNNNYRKDLESAGMRFVGLSPNGTLAEIIELEDHPFFIASQFHPEFKSRPHRPHPLFDGFIKASIQNKK